MENLLEQFFVNDEGKKIKISDLLKINPVLLVFYPGDFTLVCTKQLCSYRDRFAEFKELNVQVIGVSPDSLEDHLSFKEKNNFPFMLVSDPEKKLFKAYEMTMKLLFNAPGRGVVLLSQNGEMLYRKSELTPLSYQSVDSLVKDLSPFLSLS